MGLTLTLCLLCFGGGLVAWANWLERRPRDIDRPRLVPTTPLMFVGAMAVLLSVIHLLTLFGVELPQRTR